MDKKQQNEICFHYLAHLWDYASEKQKNAITEVKQMLIMELLKKEQGK